MVGRTEQLFPVSLIVPKEVGGAVFQERGFIFGKSGGLFVGKESDPLDMRCFDVWCPMAKPLGVDLYSSLGGLAGGVKPDMTCEIISGRIHPVEFNFGLKNVGGLNGGQERLEGNDRVILKGCGLRATALDEKFGVTVEL